ncbi:HNH endonuclease signature motif containing protein, partial [Terrabacter sp. Soil810]|uniref:HNH endonuclease signature motif containing protein n=1 Tax=Terrabacter sp. Soil810 TaxID=1736418 RepID=UPI00138F71AE
ILVLDRDRGCRFPGCGSTRNLEIHHLQHWRDGGPTDTTNLLGLCPFHHDGHHRGEFTLTGDPTHPDGLTFTTDTGLVIGPPHRPPTPHPPHLTLAPDPDPRADQKQPDRHRPPARLGRRYPAPSGGPLHLHLVDLTPRRGTTPGADPPRP